MCKECVWMRQTEAKLTEHLRPAMHACQMSDLTQRYAENMQLIVVAFWECAEDSHGDGSDD